MGQNQATKNALGGGRKGEITDWGFFETNSGEKERTCRAPEAAFFLPWFALLLLAGRPGWAVCHTSMERDSTMRSMKLMVAAAAVAVLVAGPVMAQDAAVTPAAPDTEVTTETTTPDTAVTAPATDTKETAAPVKKQAKHKKHKKHVKKHAKKTGVNSDGVTVGQ
jgi:outer membrane biosynthesis protein TonB